jgi:MFS family permease
MAGGEAAFVALVALVLERTRSPLWVSAALLAWIGVAGVVTPLAGALGDRYDRRRVMIASDLAGAACFAALAFASQPLAIVALAALAALAEAPFVPASSAAIPNLVADEDLPWANGLVSAGRATGQLAGPIAGGVLVATAGPATAFAVNAASFVVSAAIVASARGSYAARRDDENAGRHDDLGAGLRLLVRDPLLRSLTIAWVAFLSGVGTILVAELPLARSLGAGSVGYGLLIAGWAAGNLLGARLARTVVSRRPPELVLAAGIGGMALACGLVAPAPWLALVVALQCAGGTAGGLADVAEQTLLQRRIPDAVRSRVIAALEGVSMAGLAVGLAGGGVLDAAAGPRLSYLATGALGLAGAAVLARRARREPATTV